MILAHVRAVTPGTGCYAQAQRSHAREPQTTCPRPRLGHGAALVDPHERRNEVRRNFHRVVVRDAPSAAPGPRHCAGRPRRAGLRVPMGAAGGPHGSRQAGAAQPRGANGPFRGADDPLPGVDESLRGVDESFRPVDGPFLGMEERFRPVDDPLLGADSPLPGAGGPPGGRRSVLRTLTLHGRGNASRRKALLYQGLQVKAGEGRGGDASYSRGSHSYPIRTGRPGHTPRLMGRRRPPCKRATAL